MKTKNKSGIGTVLIITNNDAKKIKVKIKYNHQHNIWNVYVKLK